MYFLFRGLPLIRDICIRHAKEMAKKKSREREIAKILYVHQRYMPAEIAEKLGVNKGTVQNWITQGSWVKLRTAAETGTERLQNDLAELIQMLVEKRIELEKAPSKDRDPQDIVKEKASIGDEISKLSKALDTARKDGQPSLTAIVHVIEMFSRDLMLEDPELFKKTIEFQGNWLRKMAERYG